MMLSTHIPIRTCIGCGIKKSKRQLARIVRKNDNSIIVDESGKSPGRGAYICPNSYCAQLTKKKHKLDRAFKQSVPDSVYDEIIKTFSVTNTND